MPTFSGRRGRLWGDNGVDAERLSVTGLPTAEPADGVQLQLAAGKSRHTRTISDRFPTRPQRPADVLDRQCAVYRGWLRGAFGLTADFVQPVVTSVGNAGPTEGWGIEASADAGIARPGLQAGDSLVARAQWTFTDARPAGDPRFGNRRRPILPPHVIGPGLVPCRLPGAFGCQPRPDRAARRVRG